jgi:glutamate racemase
MLRGEPVAAGEIKAEIEPCFVDDGARTDTIVLACTHYPLILERFIEHAPWPVTWVDPAEAIARRASSLLNGQGTPAKRQVEAYFTSGKEPGEALLRSLAFFDVKPAKSGDLLVPV